MPKKDFISERIINLLREAGVLINKDKHRGRSSKAFGNRLSFIEPGSF